MISNYDCTLLKETRYDEAFNVIEPMIHNRLRRGDFDVYFYDVFSFYAVLYQGVSSHHG